MTFWKTFWASLLATVVSGIILLISFFVMLNIFISGFDDALKPKAVFLEKNTVLHMKLNEEIGDYTTANFDPSTFSVNKQVGLKDLLFGLEKAKTDDKVAGIFLNCDGISGGHATTKELRDGLLDFKESGKFIVAYSENMTAKAYYLSSAANELYVYPTGMIEFLGIGAELMFFKNALEKLDVEMQIIRGSNNRFKSAVEPFMYDHMSEANREQTSKYISALWNQMLKEIGQSKSIDVSTLNMIADSVLIRKSSDAVDQKMADGVKYYDEILELLAEKSGAESIDELELFPFSKYATKNANRDYVLSKLDKKNVALIFAEGEIVDGNGDPGQIGGNSMAAYIRDARLDKDIKAVVLRVNSPGGSALASDIIWREIVLTKAVKPVIVSMGDVAASGGYYISCAADKIYAQPNTLTGSIGVFGLIPYTGKMFENKLGITFDRVETNEHSVISLNKKLTEAELAIFQEGVDDIYDDFITKVSKGRGIDKAMVDSIGQGRVWAGIDAMEIGLIDEFGGMWDAIYYAAGMAEIDTNDISIKVFPEVKEDGLFQLIETLEEGDMMEEEVSQLETQLMEIYTSVKTLGTKATYQARIPYLFWID